MSAEDAILRVVLAQQNMLVGDIEGNAEKVIQQARVARDTHHADVILFPELTLAGYPPEDLLLRPAFQQKVDHGLAMVARGISGIDVVVGHPARGADGLYNAASLVRDGKVVATYYKQHLPNYSVFDEKRYFAAGNAPCIVVIKGWPVAITICEDLWQPGPAVQARDAGARLMFNINASPYHMGKGNEREDVLRMRIVEGGYPILYVNQVGGQDELVFDGGSLVLDRHGKVVVRAPQFEEGLFPIEIKLTPDDAEIIPGDIAAPLTDEECVYRAIVLGVRDYIEKNGFRGVVVGLSGGVDSALTLAIAVDAIGAGRVEAVMMPSRYTASISLEDARAEAEALGVEYHVIPIESVFTAFLDALADEFAGTAVDVTEENIQARCRGIILMAISNKKRKILLTTGNKSEVSVGYATLYGDMAGGFAPIKDVPKTLVYRLCHYRNSVSQVIPQRVLERPPSAELAPDQKDEDSLPPYEILDPILEMYVERDMDPEEIVAAGYDREAVTRAVYLVSRNEYKRRQAPPGVRITRRAFGRDRRYPVTTAYR